MKHIMYNTQWSWDTAKYPRYHIFLNYGRHLKDSAELPVLGGLVPNETGVLPENAFRIAKGKDGKVLVFPGEDTTNRVLLMTGIEAGHRGSCGVVEKDTTATVLLEASASNACSGSTELVVLLAPDQRLVLWSDGVDGTSYVVYTYEDGDIKVKGYSPDEWDFINSPYYLGDDEDVLFL